MELNEPCFKGGQHELFYVQHQTISEGFRVIKVNLSDPVGEDDPLPFVKVVADANWQEVLDVSREYLWCQTCDKEFVFPDEIEVEYDD